MPILNFCSRLQAPRNCTGIRHGAQRLGGKARENFGCELLLMDFAKAGGEMIGTSKNCPKIFRFFMTVYIEGCIEGMCACVYVCEILQTY